MWVLAIAAIVLAIVGFVADLWLLGLAAVALVIAIGAYGMAEVENE